MRTFKIHFLVVALVIVIPLITATAMAQSGQVKINMLGNTVWVAGDPQLILEMPYLQHPYLKVTSNSAGDLQWISTTVPFTLNSSVILGVYLCYATPDQGTYISQVRLVDYTLPTAATVRHDDGTDLIDPEGACYYSEATPFYPSGSLNLSLRLNFAQPGDEIRLGMLAIVIYETN